MTVSLEVVSTEVSQSRAAARMRRLRNRRRRGYRCAVVEFSPTDVSALIGAGLLEPAKASDLTAVEAAIGCALDRLANRYG